jgi:uncharacterized membrane protein YsdA (DUF1294 family)/cold shock CspA family protein
MRSQKAPRYQGRITSWKDEQGFGFITPNGGGPAVFVHISAFRSQGVRPASNDIVTYHLGANEKGPRAEQVALVRARVPQKPAADAKKGSLIAAAGLLGFVALSVLTGKLPSAFLGLYLGASAVAFLAYAADKSAARKNARRTRESTLHILGLVGGWPGALVAQQVLRHKSKKASFRKTFWATVLINCGVLVWCLTPSAAKVLRNIFASL